ncbi:phytoene desaturase [Corynebacterium falsenii]|uniref:Phytoene desaturase n=1 Tax=Corynebacterium falsenii TaxID=108486 RepID=A0A418QAB0_9CORY|nr:phytoene desaturase [Corynebacterium falsenii]
MNSPTPPSHTTGNDNTGSHAAAPKAVVIGAGIAGLATASLLADEGYHVEVFEKNSEPGGRAGLLEDADHPGFRWDTGPSWYLMPEAYDNFFALAGTSTDEQLDLRRLEPGYRVFPQGDAPIDVEAEPQRVKELFDSIETGAGEKVASYLEEARRIYDLSVESFLYTTFTSLASFKAIRDLPTLGNLLKNLVTSLSSHVAERFEDVRLRQVLSYPAVFLSGRPETTPALYQLMSYTDLVQGVQYPAGGFTAVVDALYRLAEQRGVRFHFNAEVTAVETTPLHATDLAGKVRARLGGQRARAVGIGVRTGDGAGEDTGVRHVPADVVVSCADVHHTETALLPKRLRSHSEGWWRRRNPGIGTVLVMLGVRGELPELSHHNLLFSKNWTPDFDQVFEQYGQPDGRSHSIYVSKPSQSDASVAPDGHENLFMLIPVAPDPTIGHGSAYRAVASNKVEKIADAAVDQLAEWAGIPDLKDRIVVRHTVGPADFEGRYHSWSGGALGPAHTLRQSAFLRGKNVASKVPNLLYAGATTVPGVGVPMCLISAENVIKRLRGDSSPAPLAEPTQPGKDS